MIWMKRFAFLLALISAQAFSASMEVSNARLFQGGKVPTNYIKNPGAEKTATGSRAGVSDIIASGGMSVSRTTTDPLEGVGSFLIDASDEDETVTWNTYLFENALKGRNCEAYFVYSGDASLYVAEVRQGSNTVASLELTNESNSRAASINFPCGDLSSQSLFRIRSTSASAAEFKLDSLYMGEATNLTEVSQASIVGTIEWANTANCRWTSSTINSDYSSDADCADNARTVTGIVSDSSSGLRPEFTINNAPPGQYIIYASGNFGALRSTTPVNGAVFLLHDGISQLGNRQYSTYSLSSSSVDSEFTGSTTHVYSFELTQTATKTINLRGGVTVGGSAFVDAANGLKFVVVRFPTSSEIAVRPEQAADLMGTVFYTPLATCPTGSVKADGSTLTDPKYAALVAKLGTSTVPDLQGIFIRGAGSQSISGTTYTGTLGTKQRDQFQGHYHEVFGYTVANPAQGTGSREINVGGASSAGYQARTIGTDGTNGTPRTGSQTHPANIALTPCMWYVSQNAPVLVGSDTSNGLSAYRSEKASVTATDASTCTINWQSDPSFITAATPVSEGVCTLTHTFANVKGCNITPHVTSHAPTRYTISNWITGLSSSSLTLNASRVDDTTDDVEVLAATFYLECWGPR